MSSFSKTIEYMNIGSKRLKLSGNSVDPRILIIYVIIAFEEIIFGICYTAVIT